MVGATFITWFKYNFFKQFIMIRYNQIAIKHNGKEKCALKCNDSP